MDAFVNWWPTSRFATVTCENAWMKELNLEALRTRIMSDALQRQVEAAEAVEAAATAAAANAAAKAKREASQPKRVQAVLARLRRAEAAVHEAHSAALRDGLIVVEELADVTPALLHHLHSQLHASSPMMARAAGAPFAQLIHHKARTVSLVAELEVTATAELQAREGSATRLASFAARAEEMHQRLHDRSAAQCVEWLREGARKQNELGQKVQARHLVENETRRVKHALEAMADWLDGAAKRRITALPERFRNLAHRALLHTVSHQVPQVGGAERHCRATISEFAAQLARSLDEEQARESDELHASIESLSKALQPREAMPVDEHMQLLCAELFFKQRHQLADLHANEQAALPKLVAAFVRILCGSSPCEDSASGLLCINGTDLTSSESFIDMMNGQIKLQRQLDALHEISRTARQTITAVSTAMSHGNATEGARRQLEHLWNAVKELDGTAAAVHSAITSAVELTSAHLRTIDGGELPRAQAMLEAASTVVKAASAIVAILRGDVAASAKVMSLSNAPSTAAGSADVTGPSGALPKEAAATLGAACAQDAAKQSAPPEPSEVMDRWGATAVSMQAEQQKLVAAAEDMEQHSQDMQGLMLQVSEPTEAAMSRFIALVQPGHSVPHAPSIAALSNTCDMFKEAMNVLLKRVLTPLGLPEVFAHLHGQLQHHKDSLNTWCYPILKLKQEFATIEEADASKASTIVTALPRPSKSSKADTKSELAVKAADDGKRNKAVKPPKVLKDAPAAASSGSTLMLSTTTSTSNECGPSYANGLATPTSAPPGLSMSLLPQSLPLPPSPTRSNHRISTVRPEMLDLAIVSRVSLELMKMLLASAEVKSNARVGHDALVRRRVQAANVVEKRNSEQQRAVAEVEALEQLLELSTVADGKGVPQTWLEERLAMLSDAVNAADLLAPHSHEEKLPKASSISTPPSAAKGSRAGEAQASKATPGGLLGSKVGKATSKEPAKGSNANKDGGGKKGKVPKGHMVETAMVSQTRDYAKRELAAKIVQAAVRGRQSFSDTQKQDLAATRVQAALRGRRARGSGHVHLATGDGAANVVQKVEGKTLIAEAGGERKRDLKKSPPAKGGSDKAAVKRTPPTKGNQRAVKKGVVPNASKQKTRPHVPKCEGTQKASPSQVGITQSVVAKAGVASGCISTTAPASTKGRQAPGKRANL